MPTYPATYPASYPATSQFTVVGGGAVDLNQLANQLSQAGVNFDLTPDEYNGLWGNFLGIAPQLISGFISPQDYAAGYAQRHSLAPSPAPDGGAVDLNQLANQLSQAGVNFDLTPDEYNGLWGNFLGIAPQLISGFISPQDYAAGYAQRHSLAPSPALAIAAGLAIAAAVFGGK